MDGLEQEGLTVSTSNMNVVSQNTTVKSANGGNDGFIEGLQEIVEKPIDTRVLELPTEFMSTLDKLMDQIKLLAPKDNFGISKSQEKVTKKPLVDTFESKPGKAKPTEEDVKKLPALNSLGFLYLGDYCKKLIKSKQDAEKKNNLSRNLEKIFKTKENQQKAPEKKENFFKNMKSLLDKINVVKRVDEKKDKFFNNIKSTLNKFTPSNLLKSLKINIPKVQNPFSRKEKAQSSNASGVLIFAGDVGKDTIALKTMLKALRYIKGIKVPNMKRYQKARSSIAKVIDDMSKLNKKTKIEPALEFNKKFKEITDSLLSSLKNLLKVSLVSTIVLNNTNATALGAINKKSQSGVLGFLFKFSKSFEYMSKHVDGSKISKVTDTFTNISQSLMKSIKSVFLASAMAILLNKDRSNAIGYAYSDKSKKGALGRLYALSKSMNFIGKNVDSRNISKTKKAFDDISIALMSSIKGVLLVSVLATISNKGFKLIGSTEKEGTFLYNLYELSKSMGDIGSKVDTQKIKNTKKVFIDIFLTFGSIAKNVIIIGIMAKPLGIALKAINDKFIGSVNNFVKKLDGLEVSKTSAKKVETTAKVVKASVSIFLNVTLAAMIALFALPIVTPALLALPLIRIFVKQLQPIVTEASKIPNLKKTMQLSLLIPFFSIITLAAIMAVPAGIFAVSGAIAMMFIGLFIKATGLVAQIAEKSRKQFYSLTISALAILGAVSLLAITMVIMNSALSIPSILLGIGSMILLGVFIGLTALVGTLAKYAILPILCATGAAILLAITAFAFLKATEALNKTDVHLQHSVETLGKITLLLLTASAAGAIALLTIIPLGFLSKASISLAISAVALNLAITNLGKINKENVKKASDGLKQVPALMWQTYKAGMIAILAAPVAIFLAIASVSLSVVSLLLPKTVERLSKLKEADVKTAISGFKKIPKLMKTIAKAGFAAVFATAGAALLMVASITLMGMAIPLKASINALRKIPWDELDMISTGFKNYSSIIKAASSAGVTGLVLLPGIKSLETVTNKFTPITESISLCVGKLKAIDWSGLDDLNSQVSLLPKIFSATKKSIKELDKINIKPAKISQMADNFKDISLSLSSLKDALQNELAISNEGIKLNDNFIQPLMNLKTPADNINNLAQSFKTLNSELKKFAKDSKSSIKIIKDLSSFNSAQTAGFQNGSVEMKDNNARSQNRLFRNSEADRPISEKDFKELMKMVDDIRDSVKPSKKSWLSDAANGLKERFGKKKDES